MALKKVHEWFEIMPMKNPYAKNPYAKKNKTASKIGSNSTNSSGQSNSNNSTFKSNALSAVAKANICDGKNNSGYSRPSATTFVGVDNDHLGAFEMENFGASTFSQAFESIEGTEHFRKSLCDDQSDKCQQKKAAVVAPAREEQLERQQQRDMDIATATTAIENTPPHTGNDNNIVMMSDRDHHVLFQQQPHVLYVSTKQRGNGILRLVRNVPFVYSRMVPDYVMSPTRCALFLSCKYHSLHPQYIHRRIAELKTDFALRILLVLADVDDNENILLHLNKICVINNLTLILSWTEEEAARYLETFKAMDGKDAALIQRKEKNNFVDQVADFLCGTGGAGGVMTSTGINKTDSAHLLSQFSNVRCIMAASMDELALVPGIGQVKVKRLYDAFQKPFSKRATKKRKKAAEMSAAAAAAAAEIGSEETIITTAKPAKAIITTVKESDAPTAEKEAAPTTATVSSNQL